MYHVRLVYADSSFTCDVEAKCVVSAITAATWAAKENGHHVGPVCDVSAQRLNVVYENVPF